MTFKLVEGENDPTTFLPLSTNIGGQTLPNKCGYQEGKYLTEEQAKHVYKKIQLGSIINTDTLQQEIEHE